MLANLDSLLDGMAGLLLTRGRSTLWTRPDSDSWA